MGCQPLSPEANTIIVDAVTKKKEKKIKKYEILFSCSFLLGFFDAINPAAAASAEADAARAPFHDKFEFSVARFASFRQTTGAIE